MVDDCRGYTIQTVFYVGEHQQRSTGNAYEPTSIMKPKCSMYGIFATIYPKNHPNVGKYTIHGSYGK